MWYDVYHQDDFEYQGTVNTFEQFYDLMVGKESTNDAELPFLFNGKNIYVPFYARKKGAYDLDLLDGFPNIEKIAFF